MSRAAKPDGPGGDRGTATVLVTGAAGFIGSHFVRLLLAASPGARVIGYDALTYAGNLENLSDCRDNPRFRFVRGDICDAVLLTPIFSEGLDAVVNLAAESHVDRSIMEAKTFVSTNVVGVEVLLDLARHHGVGRFVQISTDEVYGSLGPGEKSTEDSVLSPTNPYSASKASADLLVQAYHKTFALPTVIARCSNNYGPYQFPEKLVALTVTNLLEDKQVPLYGDGRNRRDWIHVRDHCEAILAVLERGEPGMVYNVAGGCELQNVEMVRSVLRHLGRNESAIDYVKDRPAHDRRYAMDTTRITTRLGWKPRVEFAQVLAETIDWYVSHKPWWLRVKSGEYLSFYEKQYGRSGVTGPAP